MPFLFAQQLFFQHYSEKDGLDAGVITSVEWAEGGLYVGSDQGIYKKTESKRFKKIGFSNEPEKYITRLDNNAAGRTWACNASGHIYLVSGEKLTEISLPKGLKKLLSASLVDQVEFINNSYYISAIIGGGIFQARGDAYSTLTDSLSKARFLVLELANGGLISGLSEASQDNDELMVKFRNGQGLEFMLSEEHYHSKSVVTRLSEDRYVFSRGREVIIFNQRGVLERRFCDANVEKILQDREGKIWIGFSEGGLYCFPSGELSSNNYSRYLARNTVYDMTQDGRGDLWFATSDGLFSLPKLEDAVYVAPVFSEKTNTLETTVKVEAETTKSLSVEAMSPFIVFDNSR
ncbi:MAG TPA: hypothetical protein DCX54_12710, partial [Flavobacteriales bacterium]|nr:hypothetical protein [Flavobacteriales bacterium]